MEKPRHDYVSKSHACETGSMRVEWGYRWNFPPLSFLPDVMSSGSFFTTAAFQSNMSDKVIFRCEQLGVVKQQSTIRELCEQHFPCTSFTVIKLTGGYFSYILKRGSSRVLFLFSQVSSRISASHLRFQPSRMNVCLARAYKHCHLVVISKAPNGTNSHLDSKDITQTLWSQTMSSH